MDQFFKTMGTIKYAFIPIDPSSRIDELKAERLIASSYIFVATLTKNFLSHKDTVWCLECVSLYGNTKCVLFHDIETCFFPGESEQPPSVRHLFFDKSVTFVQGIY